MFENFLKQDIAISDKNKGFWGSVKEFLPNAVHFYCCQYFLANLKNTYEIIKSNLFSDIARIRIKEKFAIILQKLFKHKHKARK